MGRAAILIVGFLLLTGTAVSHWPSTGTFASASASSSSSARRVRSVGKFDCLPKDISLDQIVTYGRTANQNITVKKKLIQIKARCRNGKLVDAKNKEIRFFRISCWGNPPADYLEIEQREQEELEELQRHYTVIVMGCNPLIQ